MNPIKKLTITLLALTLLTLLPSCSSVPITGRSQFNLVPDSMMNSMSLQSYQEFMTSAKVSTNLEQTQTVRNVGHRIQKAVETYASQNDIPLKNYQWEFNLIDDPAVNAWCMPGGKVVVYTGLLPIAQNETGLAVVMGHEIAHAIAKHGSERMSQALVVEMGGIALSEAVKTQPALTKTIFTKSYGMGTQVGVLLPFSRTHEKEADHLGLIFMAMAGYDPQQTVGFWERMAAASGNNSKPPEILSTHPADQTRINNIKALLPDAMKYYKPQP